MFRLGRRKREVSDEEKQRRLERHWEQDRRELDEALEKREGPYGIYARYRPIWDYRVERALKKAWAAEDAARSEHWFIRLIRKLFKVEVRYKTTREDIERRFAENALNELDRIEAEVSGLQIRTSIIITIITVLFAVYALLTGDNKSISVTTGLGLLGFALVTNGVAFGFAIYPLLPPIRRAWKVPYEPRHVRTLLIEDHFTAWCDARWLGDRRTPIAQKYKKMHAVAIPLLILAAGFATIGIALVFFR